MAYVEPEWMVLCLLPVLPSELRPIIQIDGGKLMSLIPNASLLGACASLSERAIYNRTPVLVGPNTLPAGGCGSWEIVSRRAEVVRGLGSKISNY